MKVVQYVVVVVVGLLVVAGVGLLVKSPRFAAPAGAADAPAPVRIVQVPDNLPAPVARWLHAEYPLGMPVYDSVLLSGRGVMRMKGVTIPMRHRVEFRPGVGFVRRMDLTWYGIGLLHGRDTFVNEKGRMETPVGPADGDRIDQGANVASWLEAISVPGSLLSDPRVRFEPVDDHTARMVFPFKDGEDSVLIGFDPDTDVPVSAKALRFRGAEDTTKHEWYVTMRGRRSAGGIWYPAEVDARWEGDPEPWATFAYDAAFPGAPVPELDAAQENAR